MALQGGPVPVPEASMLLKIKLEAVLAENAVKVGSVLSQHRTNGDITSFVIPRAG